MFLLQLVTFWNHLFISLPQWRSKMTCCDSASLARLRSKITYLSVCLSGLRFKIIGLFFCLGGLRTKLNYLCFWLSVLRSHMTCLWSCLSGLCFKLLVYVFASVRCGLNSPFMFLLQWVTFFLCSFSHTPYVCVMRLENILIHILDSAC